MRVFIGLATVLFLGFGFWFYFNYFGSRDYLPAQQTRATMTAYVKHLREFQADCKRYPTTEEGLLALTLQGQGVCEGWAGPYNSRFHTDAWGFDFLYDSNGQKYSLKSLGKDNAPGGAGPGKDITIFSDETN